MAKLPKKLKEIIEKNEALIKQALGDAFYDRVQVGDITHIDLQRMQEVIRAAALKK
jgi:hypothetical protein